MLYVLALHIIFIVTWFAGLFYIVRLFVYHSEASEKTEPERSILMRHFLSAEKKLWFGITWPSAILSYFFGFWLLIEIYGLQLPGWLVLKLSFVAGLTLYHLSCHWLYMKFRRGEIPFTGFQMRLWNEVATVFLVSIIFIVILKDSGNLFTAISVFLLLSAVLYVAVRVYKRIRQSGKQ